MLHRGAIASAIACALLLACSQNDEICTDGKDNDNNHLTDCEDTACGTGALCGPNGLACAPDRTCSACSGNGGPVEAAREVTCGDGVDNDCDGATDCDDPDCQPDGTHPGGICDASGHTCSAPDATGHSSCGAGGGTSGDTPTTSRIGSIRLARAEYEVLGALGSGYQEQSLLVFEVLAADGTAYAGLPVKFTHEAQGGSYIGAVPQCVTGTPSICTAEGTTDATGQVGVVLHSGRRYAVLSVRAQAVAGGASRDIVAGGFTVIGAKANGAYFSLDCRPYNVPALTTTDCLYSFYAGRAKNVDCTATLGDRNGNSLAVPTVVSFRSEAGEIVPAAITPAFDPNQSGAGLGQAVGILNVYGAPLPYDVDPFANETSYSLDFGCGLRKTNPRDGLVTVIAMVEGEEGFVDRNLNGLYDEGEPFVDVGEPFLDVNDDGDRDPDEWFLDLNENGGYDGPNGRWDANTVLWTQARVLYTGLPAFAHDASGNELLTRLYSFGGPPAPTPAPAPFTVHLGPPPTTQTYGAFFTDEHLNPLSPLATFSATARVGNVTAKLSDPTETGDTIATTYRNLYCDRPTQPATCRDGPAAQACTTAPCYVQPDVGDAFLYGNRAQLAITCAQVGPDEVVVSAGVEGIARQFSISGQCVP